MSPRTFLAAALSLALLQPAHGATAMAQLTGTPEDVQPPLGAELKASAEKAAEERPLFQVTEKVEGGRTRRFMIVHRAQFDKPFLFTATLDRAPGHAGMASRMMDMTALVAFTQVGDVLHFVHKQTSYRAAPGSSIERAIKDSIPDQILAVLPIVSSDTANSYVTTSADALFLSDPTRMLDDIKRMIGEGQAGLNKDESAILKLAAFKRNLIARAQYVFMIAEPKLAPRRLPLTVSYGLDELKENPDFESRPADRAVGFFTTRFNNMSSAEKKYAATPAEHMINRWDLRKADPSAPVSDVKEPVVVWLMDTIPEEYREPLKKGILAWNAAFEEIGLRNAIQVKEIDKDMTPEQRKSFDPADISYNLVHWMIAEGSAFAIGPSRVDPRTGEILNISITVGDQISRVGTDEFILGSKDPAGAGHTHDASCFLTGAHAEAATGLQLLQGVSKMSAAETSKYMGQFMTWLASHEFGHSLGLRHNFAGTTMARHSKDPALITTSNMDYPAANLAAPGKPQGDYFQTQVGPYDRNAIRAGYGTEQQRAEALERARADALLGFKTDEDMRGAGDPDAQAWDVGPDPLSFARNRTALAKQTLKGLETTQDEPEKLRQAVSVGVNAYFQSSRVAASLVGGVRTSRGAGRQYTAVSAAEQRAALKFLETEIFGKDALRVPPSVLARAGSNRFDYGANAPYPLADMAVAVQASTLRQLYSRGTLSRMINAELYTEGSGLMSASEMLDRVRRSIWTETAGTKAEPISLQRRGLQRTHIDLLAGMLRDAGMHADAQAVARRDLQRIARDAAKALATAPDETTRLHLAERLRQAKEALEPKDD